MLIALALVFVFGALWIGVLALAMATLWRGLRGRRADAFPRCRRCRYNLVGTQTRPRQCPECGINLRLPGAVRLGRRRPQGRVVGLGAFLFAAGLSPIAFMWHPSASRAPAPVAAGAVTLSRNTLAPIVVAPPVDVAPADPAPEGAELAQRPLRARRSRAAVSPEPPVVAAVTGARSLEPVEPLGPLEPGGDGSRIVWRWDWTPRLSSGIPAR